MKNGLITARADLRIKPCDTNEWKWHCSYPIAFDVHIRWWPGQYFAGGSIITARGSFFFFFFFSYNYFSDFQFWVCYYYHQVQQLLTTQRKIIKWNKTRHLKALESHQLLTLEMYSWWAISSDWIVLWIALFTGFVREIGSVWIGTSRFNQPVDTLTALSRLISTVNCELSILSIIEHIEWIIISI